MLSVSQRGLSSAAPTRHYSASRPFVDRVKVLLASGAGGDGASIMGSLMNNEFAGPMGGNGGRGGDLFVVSSKRVQDLAHIADLGPQVVAEKGQIGFNLLSSGRKGQALELVVPVGTQVVDIDTNEVVVDLDESDLKVLLLEGGQGGKGNASFANSIVHSPKEATRGLPGNTMLANIELKLIADCGLVGYPNAGKSSLLNAISTSRPKIANYPFTTLNPYVGHVHDLYGQMCSVADLPGLIEGAFENRGLGHQFLRHVERTTAIAFVIDMYSPFVPSDSSISAAMAAAASLEAAAQHHAAAVIAEGGGTASAAASASSSSSASAAASAHAHALRHDADDAAAHAAKTAAALSLQTRSRGGLRTEVDSAGLFGDELPEEESFAEYAKRNPDQFLTGEEGAASSSSSSPSSGSAAGNDDPFAFAATRVTMQQPWEILETLQQELEFYLPGLSEKGLVVIANKMDMPRDAAGNCMKAKLEELRRRTYLPVFAVSARSAIEFGVHHPSAGDMSKALTHITSHVYAAKKAKAELSNASAAQLEGELESIFRGRNVAHFTPVDFTSWRAQVRSSSGGFSGFDGGDRMSGHGDRSTDYNSAGGESAAANRYGGNSDVVDGFGFDGNASSSSSSLGASSSSQRGGHPLIDHRVSAEGLLDAEGPPISRSRNPRIRDPEVEAATSAHFTDSSLSSSPSSANLSCKSAAAAAGRGEDGYADNDEAIAASSFSSDGGDAYEDYASYDMDASEEGEDPFAEEAGAGKAAAGCGTNTNSNSNKNKSSSAVDDGFSADEFAEALSRSAALGRGAVPADPAAGGDPLHYYSFSEDAAAANRLSRDGGVRTRHINSAATSSADAAANASSSSDVVVDAGGNIFDASPLDLEAAVEGPLVGAEDMALSDTRLLKGVSADKEFVVKYHHTAPTTRKSNNDVGTATAASNSNSSSSPTTAAAAAAAEGFFLRRRPKKTFGGADRPMPTYGSNNSGSDNNRNQQQLMRERRKEFETASALPSEEVMALVRPLVGASHGGADGGDSDMHMSSSLASSGSSAASQLPSSSTPASAAIRAARAASAAALSAERHRMGGGHRARVLDAEELSLVDQQLDDSVGQSGYGEAFDAYKGRPLRSRFGNFRDPSLRGQYWQRSRLPGERLPDEKWN